MLKRSIFILLAALGLCTAMSAPSDNFDHAREVELWKEKPESGMPRAPELNPAQFSATLFMDELIIFAENYDGAITVEIAGAGGQITQTLSIARSEPAVIDISSLPEGFYSIRVISARGIYTGLFEL